ncbi:pentatricopeptide repeat-containing protein At3g14730 [Olea europaea var. sylvestris]|uniref:pentatricopeptide repeat-containing protein At3g14730 n=1 Tax=Olea europaea var. sylvestris TaxID=158386 RepID=UPI000C1D259E|nr:pentatricopeptide repeat-containing protein At3g14730 [Olea europaea var. sylvestris]XP_022846231.1 pentatricopeptide repeat-containing protein At3g14730 [Olea europaea var. sylvestris]XP_022846238.1 pentatricopeptide repeat-containing protein At3g14730 [Olea europaea var. sylvestris]
MHRTIHPARLFRTNYRFSLNFSSKPTQTRTLPLDLPSCIASLQSCAQRQDLSGGRKLHSHMIVNGNLESPVSATSLINMYSKSDSIADALCVFHASTGIHNVFVYNAIIAGFTVNDMANEAFEFYYKMRLIGIEPDKFTFPCAVKACPDTVSLEKIHGLLFKLGLEFDLFIGSALVHCYLKFDLVNEALEVFEELPNRDDAVLWNAMINGYMQIGEFNNALEIFRRMGEFRIIPNRFTITGALSALSLAGDVYNGKLIHGFVIKLRYDCGIAVLNALIDMYGKCRLKMDALKIFEDMIEKDIYSWNSIISVHEQCGDHERTLSLFKRMFRAGVWPDLVSVTAVLPACSNLAALMHGREIHGYMIINGLGKDGGTYIDNAIMDMYAKCGSMREAHLVFDTMRCRDVASWNIMVMGYGMHGFGNKALDLFFRMCKAGLKPDEVSFVGVLSACSHAGFVSEGRELLAQMQPQYGVIPTIEHYSCVIDMLGRAGQLEEAYQLLSKMTVPVNPIVWRAFLSACRLHGNANLAEVAAQRVLELEPEHCGSYVLMSNIFGAAGRFEEVAEVRHAMRQQDVSKRPGCSWIELNNGLHVFVTGDRAHPEEYFIYAGLDSLTERLCEHGYLLDVMESSN